MFLVLAALLGLLVYFLPALLAFAGNHRKWRQLSLVNLLLGWTVIGWIAALIWALMDSSEKGEPP